MPKNEWTDRRDRPYHCYEITMIKYILILMLTTLTTGCPPVLMGHIKNDSNSTIVLSSSFSERNGLEIPPDTTEVTHWNYGCLEITQKNEISFYSVYPLPDNTTKADWPRFFQQKAEFTYKNNELFIKAREGNLLQLQKVKSCKNT